MIRVHLTVIVFLYLAAYLVVIGGASLLDERRRPAGPAGLCNFGCVARYVGLNSRTEAPPRCRFARVAGGPTSAWKSTLFNPDVFSF